MKLIKFSFQRKSVTIVDNSNQIRYGIDYKDLQKEQIVK